MTIFLTVFVLMSFYVSKRFINKLDIHKRYKKYFNIFLVINFLGIIGYLSGRYYTNIPNTLYFLFSLPIGVLFLLFCTAVIYDISRVSIEKIPLKPTRRKFFKKSFDIFSLIGAVALSGRALYEARFVKIEKVDRFKIIKVSK